MVTKEEAKKTFEKLLSIKEEDVPEHKREIFNQLQPHFKNLLSGYFKEEKED